MTDLCLSCWNEYIDDCGYCCRHEGDDGCPYGEENVQECPFYVEDKEIPL